ncbi:hypothetical protein HN358_04710 [Candidatus Uhrbacteria bacterium]|jgi:hypothetical protein|nr:hypothetical protein [Candidatus Uhrbacteria bacterium]MBT7717084.1 hypothetical protein [Candidatus Uhrbacteria bacterium]
MKKISYLIGGFVVIALAFFVWSSVSKDAINVEDIVWLEYQSENFDIAFEYPEIASVSEVGSGEFSDLSDSEFEYLGSIDVSAGEEYLQTTKTGDFSLSISIFTNPGFLEPQEWAQGYRTHEVNGVGLSGLLTEFQISDYVGYAGKWGCCATYRKVVLVPINDQMYVITYGSGGGIYEILDEELDDMYFIPRIFDTLLFKQ